MKKPTRFEKLGFGREVKLPWMNLGLTLALQGCSAKEAKDTATNYIASEATEGGARGAVSVVKEIRFAACWFKPQKELQTFRDQLLEIARELPQTDWPILHWAILVANYPFLFKVSEVLGRLFSLQGEVNKAQVEKRLADFYGAQAVLERNMRYALSTLVHLGMLKMNGRTGVYLMPEETYQTGFETTAAIWKAALHATQGGLLPLTSMRNSLAFYSFRPSVISLSQFVQYFKDVDYRQFVAADEQVFLKTESR